MPLSCGLPPVDMRFARVVAINGQGLDIVAFSGGHPSGAPVVSPIAGIAHPSAGLLRYGYRNAVVIEAQGARPDGHSLYVCLSGLAFEGRPDDGMIVQAGTPVGAIEVPGRIDFLRSRDRTAGVDSANPYLHVEAWTLSPPRFTSRVGVMGPVYSIETGVVSPSEFWGGLGIDFVGPARSQTMAIRRGGPSDCVRSA